MQTVLLEKTKMYVAHHQKQLTQYYWRDDYRENINTSPSTRMSTILGGTIMSSTNLANLDSATFWEKKKGPILLHTTLVQMGKDRKF